MALLSDDEVDAGLGRLQGWQRQGGEITRQFEFKRFPDAVAFVNRVAGAADAADHHSDIDIRYNKVRLTLSTHSEGGITAKDLELAARADELAT